MAFELQDLSTSSGSDGDVDFDVPDTEIARALNQPEEVGDVATERPSRWRFALKTMGIMFAVLGVIAALGFIFNVQHENELDQVQLKEELHQVEVFVQYFPDKEPLDDLSEETLKTTDPPPM